MVRIKEVTDYVKNLADTKRAVDYDSAYNFQCFDLTQAVSDGFFHHWLTGNGAKDLVNSPIPSDWKRLRNTASFQAEAGDIAIFTWGTWGHTAIIIDGNPRNNLTTFSVVEQNAKGTGLEPATYNEYDYSLLWGVIRPPYEDYNKKKVKSKIKTKFKKPKASKAKKILLVAGHGKGYTVDGRLNNDSGAVGNGTNERDFIRKNIVPKIQRYLIKAGHTVDLYGGNTMNQDLFQDSAYGQALGNYKDYGMYWVARQKYDIVIEFHLDASTNTNVSGGHVIIGTGLAADDIDRGIQNVITKNVGALHDIAGRDNLLNVNLAKSYGVNYRLVELGFITSKKDMDYIKNHLDQYTKGIAEAIHGNEIVSTINTAESKKQKKVAQKRATKKSIVYTIKAGDSLWTIAKKYKTTVDKLKELNQLKSDSIFINQKLIIKK